MVLPQLAPCFTCHPRWGIGVGFTQTNDCYALRSGLLPSVIAHDGSHKPPIVVSGLGIPCTPRHIKLNARQLRLGQACSGYGQAKFVIWLPAKEHHVSDVHSKLEWKIRSLLTEKSSTIAVACSTLVW
jgi:hypothetical protein